MSRAERLFALARFLQGGSGRTLREIVAQFDVSERTLFRDLAALEEQGIPIVHLEGGRYRVDNGRPVAPVFDSTDLALVRVALADAPRGATGPLSRRWAQLVDKLEAALRGRFASRGPTPANDDLVRATLEQAIAARRPVTLVYRSLSGGTESERGVEPWRLLQRAGGWYLIARCQLHGEPRLFRLERIRSVRATTRRFAAAPEFDVESFLDRAWRTYLGPTPVTVRLCLAPSAARDLPAALEAIAPARPLADGTVEICARALDLEAVADWLAGLGPHATVIEPKELRLRVRRQASAALDDRRAAMARGAQ